jgi:hypothetical protein
MKEQQRSFIIWFGNNKFYQWLVWAAGLIGVALVAWSLWPLASLEVDFPLSSMYLEGGRVELGWPARVRRGGTEGISLGLDTTGLMIEIESSEGPVLMPLSDLEADFNPVLEARLELSGSEVVPSGPVREPFLSGQRVEYEWVATPRRGGVLNGRIWLYLELVPATGDDEVTVRYPVLARPLEIESRTILGLGIFGVRALGGGLILMSLWVLWFIGKKRT